MGFISPMRIDSNAFHSATHPAHELRQPPGGVANEHNTNERTTTAVVKHFIFAPLANDVSARSSAHPAPRAGHDCERVEIVDVELVA